MTIAKSSSSAAYRFWPAPVPSPCRTDGYGQGIHNVTSKFRMQIPSKYSPGQSQLYRFHYANDTTAKRCRPCAPLWTSSQPVEASSDRHVNVFRTQATMLGTRPATLLCSHRCGGIGTTSLKCSSSDVSHFFLFIS